MISARWDTDLSPGTLAVPFSGPDFREIRGSNDAEPAMAVAALCNISVVEKAPRRYFDRPWRFVANAAPFSSSQRTVTLIKPELGTKRVCPSCAARFYDLQKRPIECPKCNFAFEPEMLLKQRRTRAPEEVKPAVVAEPEDEEEVETAAEEEAEDATADEEELEEELAETDVPLVAADVDADEEEAPAAAEEEAVEPEEFEEDLDAEEDEDDDLLEEVEEDEDDVSGIIDADIEKDEP
jgi:uncharacterized protein (TIGR02300 family)